MIVRQTIDSDFDSADFREHVGHRVTDGAWTVLLGDEVVAVMGIAKYWEGVGHIWAMVTDKVHEHPIKFTRIARSLLKMQMEIGRYHRVQAFIGEDYRNLRWARICGLVRETKLEKMLPDGSDCWVYSLIGE